MKALGLMVLGCLVAAGNLSAETCQHTPTSFSCVTYVRNYDADTITVEIPGVHPLFGSKISVRVAGVDAPEIRTTDPCEKRAAKAAKEFVGKMLGSASRITLSNIARGKYFRVLADVVVDGVSVSNALLERRLAYPYDGGTKQKVDWCAIGDLEK